MRHLEGCERCPFLRRVPRPVILLGPLVVTALLLAGIAIAGESADTTPPVVTAPDDMVVAATEPAGATVSYAAATATDDVAVTVGPICMPPSGSFFIVAGSPHTVTCIAGDAAGNVGSDTFTVTVTASVDDVDPVFGSPSGTTVFDATGTPGQEPVPFTITATDNVDTDVAIVCSPPSGSSFPLGSSNVSCTATDDSGNSAQTSFSVTVQDSGAPIVTPPSNVVVEATGPSGAAVTYGQATAVDPPSNSPLQATCSPPSGSTFPLGVTNVVCSATDAASQTGTAQFSVTVQDTTPPTVTAPSGVTVQPSGPTGATVTYPDASATDLVGVVSGPTCSPASGSVFPIGTSLVTCTASDRAGNTGTSSFSISVQDGGAPLVSVPVSRTVEANGPGGAIVNYATPTAVDLVDGPLLATCSKPSGSVFPLGVTVVTCSATDSGGRTGSASFTVTVVDSTAPVLTVPADISIQSSSAVPATNSRSRTSSAGRLRATSSTRACRSATTPRRASRSGRPRSSSGGGQRGQRHREERRRDRHNPARRAAHVDGHDSSGQRPRRQSDRGQPVRRDRMARATGAGLPPRHITRSPGLKGAPQTVVYSGKKKTSSPVASRTVSSTGS